MEDQLSSFEERMVAAAVLLALRDRVEGSCLSVEDYAGMLPESIRDEFRRRMGTLEELARRASR